MNDVVLKNALYSTYDKFNRNSKSDEDTKGLSQAASAMMKFMKEGNLDYFTRDNNARRNMQTNIRKEELAEYLAGYYMQLIRIENPKNYDELLFACQVLGKPYKVAAEQLKDCLLGKRNEIGSFQYEQIARFICGNYTRIEMRQMARAEEEKLAKKAQARVAPKYGVKNLQVNNRLVNYCREEVLSGKQIAIQNDIKRNNLTARPRREYNLKDELVAVTDIGQRRTTQQDAVLMLYHPQNPKYKFLVVADGMGGSVDGDKASQEIVRQMVSWFENLNPNMMLDVNSERLRQEWDRKLNEINDYILDTNPKSGSTFVGAIVGETSTTIASIGDSRCYALAKDNKLYQMTTDDNYDFLMYKRKWEEHARGLGGRLTVRDLRLMAQEKENLRFKRGSNRITKCIGANREGPIGARFNRLSNSSYKSLMLFSDGVTDCLSDNQLLAITKNTSPKDLARRIVDEAISVRSVRNDLIGNGEYYSEIAEGKDNASAVIYNRKSDGEER